MISKGRAFLALFIACVLLLPLCSAQAASDLTLEKQLQQHITRSRELVTTILSRMREGKPYQSTLAELTGMASGLKTAKDKLAEQFEQQQADISTRGAKAADRHGAMLNSFRDNIDAYLKSLENLDKSGPSIPALETLKTLLDRIAPARPAPLYGALPYRHAGFAGRRPLTSPTVLPAYRGGSLGDTSADLASTDLAPITLEIATLAQSLGWNPVSIYEWVKNNVKTEWYWGSMKGAVETLHQKSGNDCDQAALVAALLRAAGFRVRYVRGVVEFFPDLDSARRQTGLTDEKDIALFFQKAGIPFTQVIAGGKVANFQIEHIWVEAQAPYANYRGNVLDGMGKTWLGLDTSIKPAGYQTTPQNTDFAGLDIYSLRDTYLAAIQTRTPLEYLRQFVAAALPGAGYDSLLDKRILVPEVLNLLPASLQFKEAAITGEYTDLPDELIHQVRFTATGGAAKQVLFDTTLDVREASNKQIVIAYEPETVDDQEIINSYGGLDNTPGYLVRLRPVLKIDGERRAVAADGLAIGENFTLTITLTGPGASSQIVANNLITGNLTVLGIAAQQAVSPEVIPDDQKTAARILFEQAQNYNQQWNAAEDELAALLRLALARPTATIVTLAGVADVTYVLDKPHGFEWKGLYVDAGLRTAETAGGVTFTSGSDAGKLFMQLSGLQGSVLEHRLYESALGVQSISTAKLFGLAADGNITVITIDTTNSATIDTLLPGLNATIRQDIVNAVNQGYTVRIPQSGLSYEDWTGTGYIKENLATGEAGYMLTGMIAGGMTALNTDRWQQSYLDMFEHPYSELPNPDPLSAQTIQKITATDMQQGTVGELISKPLQVIVYDSTMKPVENAQVLFAVVSGEGTLSGGDVAGISVQVKTNSAGIASAEFLLGEKTSVNSTVSWEEGMKYGQQVSQSLIDARLITGANTGIQIPFTVIGLPDKPAKIEKAFGDSSSALVNTSAGSIRAVLADKYGNPLSNEMLTFTVKDAVSLNPQVPLPSNFRNMKLILPEECHNPYPVYAESGSECQLHETLSIETSSNGSLVNTMLGDTVNTQYTVEVSHEGVPSENFILSTTGLRKEPGSYSAPELFIRYLTITNDKGESVNAAKIGEKLKAPLVSELFMLLDDYSMEGPATCTKDGVTTDCWKIKPSGTVKLKTINGGNVTYSATSGGGSILPPGTGEIGNGKYQAWYQTGMVASLNQVEAEGEATVTVPMVYNDPNYPNHAKTDGYVQDHLDTVSLKLKTGQKALFDEETKEPALFGSQKIIYDIYGVEIKTDPQMVVPVELTGMVKQDTKINYTIQPLEYMAQTAYVILFKDGYPMEYIAAETHGQGYATIARGYVFDLKGTHVYQAQVVLNIGSDLEISSQQITIIPAECDLSIGYTATQSRYDEIIKCAATDTGVNPWTIKEIIRAENSSFENNIVIPHDQSTGLMQITPDTARTLDPSITGSNEQIVTMLKNPCININLGARNLKEKVLGDILQAFIDNQVISNINNVTDEDKRVLLEAKFNLGSNSIKYVATIARNNNLEIESWGDLIANQDILYNTSLLRNAIEQTLSCTAEDNAGKINPDKDRMKANFDLNNDNYLDKNEWLDWRYAVAVNRMTKASEYFKNKGNNNCGVNTFNCNKSLMQSQCNN